MGSGCGLEVLADYRIDRYPGSGVGAADYHTNRRRYSNSLNSLGVRPASVAIAPIVKEFTGLWRGIVRRTCPFDMTTCLPSRTTTKPTFPRGSHSILKVDPGIFGTRLDAHFFLYNMQLRPFYLFGFQPFPYGASGVLKCLINCVPLRMTSAQGRARRGVAFLRLNKNDSIVHK